MMAHFKTKSLKNGGRVAKDVDKENKQPQHWQLAHFVPQNTKTTCSHSTRYKLSYGINVHPPILSPLVMLFTWLAAKNSYYEHAYSLEADNSVTALTLSKDGVYSEGQNCSSGQQF
jgi:hypothetical protein